METIKPKKIKLVIPKQKSNPKRMSAFEEREYNKKREKILSSYFNLKDTNYPVFIDPKNIKNSKNNNRIFSMTPKLLSKYKPLRRHEYNYHHKQQNLKIYNYEFIMNPFINSKDSEKKLIIPQSTEENNSQPRNQTPNVSSVKNALNIKYKNIRKPKSSYHFKRINIEANVIFKDFNNKITQNQSSIKNRIKNNVHSQFNDQFNSFKNMTLKIKAPSSTSTKFYFNNRYRRLKTSSLPKNIEQQSNGICEPCNNIVLYKKNQKIKFTPKQNINLVKQNLEIIPNNQLKNLNDNIEYKDYNNQMKLIRKVEDENSEIISKETDFQK